MPGCTGHTLHTLLMYLLITSGNLGAVQEKPDLNIMGFLPMTGQQWYGGGACLPAIDMALKIANEREDILPGYNLRYIWKDDKCDAGYATDGMYEMLYEDPIKHIISGPACSVAAEATARSSHMWNLTHLSWAAASPLLSDKVKFPGFFRVAPPDTNFNQLRVALMRHFNWKKVATINVALDYFFAVMDDFIKTIKDTDIEIITQEIFDNDPTERVQHLKDKDARIILSGSYENQARLILCAAYRVGLYGPKVVWIFPGWYGEYWWRLNIENVPCTSEQMDKAAEGQLLTGFIKQNRDLLEKSAAGLNVMEFQEQRLAHELYKPELAAFDFVAPNCFDHIWGIALALNCSNAYLEATGSNSSLQDFTYADSEMGDVIRSCTHNLTFLGMAGRVNLTLRDPIKSMRLMQVYGLEKSTVAYYDSNSNMEKWLFEWIDGGIKWKGNNVPRDSTQVTIVVVTMSVHLYVLVSCIASMGILLSIILFVFNVLHREHVFVKLSSPNINNILLLGCVFTYSVVFMQSLTGDTIILCKMRMFMFTIGFSLAFGALFSKTWRVYKIFSNKKLLRLKIHDSQLMIIVGVLVITVSSVLILWEILDPLVVVEEFLEKEVYFIENDAEVRPYIHVCVSEWENYFTWTIYIIEGVVLVFGAFLSFETRRVKIAALNDSRLIGLCIYNVVVLAAIGVTLALVLSTQPSLLYGITSGFIILGTTATQLIVFVPKVTAVYYPHHINPEINDRITGSHPTAATIATTSDKRLVAISGPSTEMTPTSSNRQS